MGRKKVEKRRKRKGKIIVAKKEKKIKFYFTVSLFMQKIQKIRKDQK